MTISLLAANPPSTAGLSRGVIVMLSVMCGVSIASAYYAQPLLPAIGRSLNVSETLMGLVPMLTQIGIGVGVVLLLPLGDIIDGRRLILGLIGAHIVALATVASAQSAMALNWLSFTMGLTTVTPYLLPAFAAKLTPLAQRGHVTGLLARGVFAGILLARTLSAYVGYFSGWRTIYWIAVVAMLGMGALLVRKLPSSPPQLKLSYSTLLRSLVTVFAEHRTLRIAALTQGLLFGGFNAFWITLSFYLESPRFHAASYVSGLFGIIGLVGAMAAPVFGRLADQRGPVFAVRIGSLITLGAWAVFATVGGTLAGLVVGVLLLDLGTTACHVSNQAVIYRLGSEVRSRVTTLYILGLFVGAAVLSPLATFAWAHVGWIGVCAVGSVATLLAVVANHLPNTEGGAQLQKSSV